jgi:putative photosynthetic complex assembly protein
MSTHHGHTEMVIPRTALFAAGALMLGSLVFVYLARTTDTGLPAAPMAAVVEQRSLTFEDSADGGLVVTDHLSGEVVALLSDQDDGLVEAMLRGLKHGRVIARAEGQAVYVLTLYEDGRLAIADPDSGVDISLASFGGRNRAMFASFLTVEKPR